MIIIYIYIIYIYTCVEKQPVLEETESRKEETEPLHSEYKLFTQYHSRLSAIPSLVDLTSYFVTANIITKSDGETITNTVAAKSQKDALIKLLSKICLVLLRGHCDSKSFEKMLKIMQIYGTDTAQHVASEMLEAVSAPSPIQTTLPNTGMYV